ncbi:MAG TPA: hypothetical protein VK891_18245 [Euzebyales bacterium]|nr:hypothetical protein [Euzebyales bacterium]
MSETQPRQAVPHGTTAEEQPGSWAMMLGVICLVVALLAFGLGAWQRSRANSFDPDVVTCGDDVMQPGDTCLDFSGRAGGDYAQVREQQRSGRERAQGLAGTGMRVARVAVVAGGVLVLLGVLELRIRKRWSARKRSGAP